MSSESTAVIGGRSLWTLDSSAPAPPGVAPDDPWQGHGFWQSMLAGLLLKSPWSASSLADPDRAYTLHRYVRACDGERTEPIPVPMFIDYCRWFLRHAVGEVGDVRVEQVCREREGFRLDARHGRVGCGPGDTARDADDASLCEVRTRPNYLLRSRLRRPLPVRGDIVSVVCRAARGQIRIRSGGSRIKSTDGRVG